MTVRYDFKADAQTTQRMKHVRTSGTAIEKKVRSTLHQLGFRFTLRNSRIPGKPDIILPRHKTVVFVHGCFWHGHSGCKKGMVRPKRNVDFWGDKIRLNKERDLRIKNKLEENGWKVLVIWECEVLDVSRLNEVITEHFKRIEDPIL